MASELRDELSERLAQLAAAGLSRTLELPREDRTDFTSNDYLGLSRHPALVAAACKAAQEHGAGARASRLLGGGAAHDREAERALAQWLGVEDALLFASGFQANLGVVTSLVQPGDALFSDSLNHASLIDAARLTKARRFVYAHADMAQLEAQLASASAARRRWVLTEGVFSMDGDLAELVEISELCARYDAWLIVDEAHSIGVIGSEGAGAWAAARAAGAQQSRIAALVVPCGKALGAQGGFVAGCAELRELLLGTARSFVFSTGLAPASSAAIRASIELARAAAAQRARLHELAAELASRLGTQPAPAAIATVILGDNSSAMHLARSLQGSGLDVRAVRPPTVPEGSARLRIVLHAYNSLEEVEQLGRALAPHAAGSALTATTRRAPLVVVGTDTGIGKTVVSAALVRAAARAGAVSYWKPVQTGDDSDTETVRELAAGTCASFEAPRFAFPLPASPHEAAADVGATIDPSLLDARWHELLQGIEGELIIELAGGLLVPYDERETQADLLARLQPRLVLVARSGLGTLNHTLLTLEALRARGLEPTALVLVGDEHPSNRETLRRMGRMPRIFELPHLPELSAAALDEWLDDNDLSVVFDA